MESGEGRLVVLRALGLGDFLTGLPALRGLEAAFPDYQRLLAAPEWLRPLADLAGWPLLPFTLSRNARVPLISAELAVNLHGKGPESHRALLPVNPERFFACANEEISLSAGFPALRQDEHEIARWCSLLQEFGVPADPTRLELRVSPQWLPQELMALGPMVEAVPNATVIHPGAASPARRWPPERWAEIARFRKEAGSTVLLTGGRGERALCERVRAQAGLPPEANLAGKTDLVLLARLVSVAALALSGDTGFAHLATAVGTPSVVLFGPVSPHAWGPPKDRIRHRAVWKGQLGDPHANRPDPGLLRIQVAEVLTAIDEAEAAANRLSQNPVEGRLSRKVTAHPMNSATGRS